MYPAFRGFYERNSLIEQGRMKIVQGIELQTLASGSGQIDIEGTLCGTGKQNILIRKSPDPRSVNEPERRKSKIGLHHIQPLDQVGQDEGKWYPEPFRRSEKEKKADCS